MTTPAEKKLMATYRESHTRCAICHGEERPWRKLSVHHIVGRRGKSPHDHRNLILVCEDTCHDGIHRNAGGTSLSLGNVLWAKREEDGAVDLAFLAGLKGRHGLREDPSPLPLWATESRIDNHHEP